MDNYMANPIDFKSDDQSGAMTFSNNILTNVF